MAECVNLRDRFGDTYRVAYEESYFAERGPNARTAAPWLMTIPCHRAHIFPWGGRQLAVSLDGRRPKIARRLREIGCRVLQDGSDGVTLGFDADVFERVAEIVHPKRRRRLSQEQRDRLVQAGAGFRFSTGLTGQKSERPCVGEGAPDQLPVPGTLPEKAA